MRTCVVHIPVPCHLFLLVNQGDCNTIFLFFFFFTDASTSDGFGEMATHVGANAVSTSTGRIDQRNARRTRFRGRMTRMRHPFCSRQQTPNHHKQSMLTRRYDRTDEEARCGDKDADKRASSGHTQSVPARSCGRTRMSSPRTTRADSCHIDPECNNKPNKTTKLWEDKKPTL
jgi:hypothetical protein